MMDTFFTVLLSVYCKEKPEFLQRSLRSIVDQSLRPSQIVIVRDGKLTPALDAVLDSFQNEFPSLCRIIGYETNRGLGHALQFGLKYVQTPWVARMDADDVAVPDRFEKQVSFIASHPEVDVLGSYIAEFEYNEEETVRIRKVPLDHADILFKSKLFCPMNHMTVFMRTEKVREAGGYQHAPFFEDYYLWVRMLSKGMIFHNVPDSLVLARIGNDMVGKRHGMSYLKHEYAQFKRMHDMNYVSSLQYYMALILRLPLRLAPKKILSIFYNLALRKKTDPPSRR